MSDTGKDATTNFRVLAASESFHCTDSTISPCAPPGIEKTLESRGCCLIECEPKTGRTHQIRVHLAYAGHPILGDDLYGITGPWIGRHALHAAQLKVKHPSDSQELSINAPLPLDMLTAMESLGIRYDVGN